MLFVPQGGDFLVGLADVGAVDNFTSEGASIVEGVDNAPVHTHTDAQVALGIDGRAEDGDAGANRAPFPEQADQCFHFTFLHVLDNTGREGCVLGNELHEAFRVCGVPQVDLGAVFRKRLY